MRIFLKIESNSEDLISSEIKIDLKNGTVKKIIYDKKLYPLNIEVFDELQGSLISNDRDTKYSEIK